jgi:hypothetical protein
MSLPHDLLDALDSRHLRMRAQYDIGYPEKFEDRPAQLQTRLSASIRRDDYDLFSFPFCRTGHPDLLFLRLPAVLYGETRTQATFDFICGLNTLDDCGAVGQHLRDTCTHIGRVVTHSDDRIRTHLCRLHGHQ